MAILIFILLVACIVFCIFSLGSLFNNNSGGGLSFLLIAIICLGLSVSLIMIQAKEEAKWHTNRNPVVDVHQKGVISAYNQNGFILDTTTTAITKDCWQVPSGRSQVTECGTPYLIKEQVIKINVGNIAESLIGAYNSNTLVDVGYSCESKCSSIEDYSGNCCTAKKIIFIGRN